jgi:hypothetical protein
MLPLWRAAAIFGRFFILSDAATPLELTPDAGGVVWVDSYRMLNTNGKEVPLIPTLRLRSVSAEGGGGGGGVGAGVAAPKGSTYTYTSLHVASTAPTTKATPTGKKTPRSGGSSAKKAVKKKSMRPSTPSPAAIMLRAMEVASKELPVSMERENVVSVSTAAEAELKSKRSLVRSEQEMQSSEPRPARQPHDAQQPQAESTVTAPDVQQRQPLVAVNVTTEAKGTTAGVVCTAVPQKSPEVAVSVREAESARKTEQRRVVSTTMTERKAKAKVEVELKDPGSALMQRAAQLLWDDLGMDDAWIDHLLSASSPSRCSRSPSPAPAPPTPPPPCVPEAIAGLPKHQWVRPAPLIIANSNTDW